MVVLVPLTRGMHSVIDECDREVVLSMKWHAVPHGRTAYARTDIRGKVVPMHRLIMDAKPGQIVDHINGDGLDNRRCNLRICLHSENLRNSQKPKDASASKYKGVHRSGKKWRSQIRVNKKGFHGGTFDTEDEAARDYDRLAKIHFGEFARLNFPHEHLVNTEGK